MLQGKQKKAIVVGAGIAGIASAIRLANKGYSVTVVDANKTPGGKLSEIRRDGFRFDAGPSLFTMPQYVEELFTLSGKEPSKYFQFERLENTGIYFYPDGTKLTAYSNAKLFANEFHSKLNVPLKSIQKFFKKSEKIYNITHKVFLESSLHSLKTFLRFQTLWSVVRLPAIDAFRTMNVALASVFKHHPKAQQFFNRYATYNGSDPFRAPATLNIIPHLEHSLGAYFPVKGMYSIAQSLVDLAKELGVEFLQETSVERIIHQNKKVKEVLISDRNVKNKLQADLVLCNMDIVPAYRKLLPDLKAPENILNQEKSSSALIFYWGMNRVFEELDLHNIFFTENYKNEFSSMRKGEVSDDPTVYVYISSKKNKSDAPEGNENWFVMINTPHHQGQDWEKIIFEARKNIIQNLSRRLNTDIEKYILFEEILDPLKIETRTSSHLGALYGNSSNNMFSAFLRHSNKSKKLNGLYFCGGSVHPGGGIPLALLSAKISCELIPN